MSELDHCVPRGELAPTKSYLFYGPGGTGKTTFALHHPGKRKLVMDIDDKLREMENLPPEQLAGVDVWAPGEQLNPREINFTIVDPKRKDTTIGYVGGPEPRGFRRQVAITNELLELAKDTSVPFKYDCVIWDSGTRTVDHLIKLILHAHKMGSMTETLWGVFGANFLEYLSGFLRLPCDRIVIFHDRHQVKRDKEGSIIEETTRPSVYGQNANNIVTFFSEVYYFLGRSSGKYMIQTGADAILPARTSKVGLEFRQVLDPAVIYGNQKAI